jgi:Secretion system C-terminal sorting domain
MLKHVRRSNNYLIFVLLIFFIWGNHIFAQSEQIRIMAYNLLEYPNNADAYGTASYRDPYFRTIMSSVDPDIIAACEFNDNTETSPLYFLSDVLNYSSPSLYDMGTFIKNGSHSDVSVVYYKPSKFTFLSSKLIIPEDSHTNHPSYEYQLYNNLTGNKIIIFGIHLTSGTGSTAESYRDANADTVRSYSDALPIGSYFIAAGDYNFYAGGNEPAYATLLANTNSGYFLDPLTLSGNWSTDVSNYQYQTLSTRTSSFGGSSESTGLKYRIDLILNSQSIVDAGGVTYNSSSFTTYGNDGLHNLLSVNSYGSTGLVNQAVSQPIANALYYASDHLPVYADYTFALPSTINPPYQGSIAFTQVGVGDGTLGHDDEIEFVTLYRMNLTSLKITNNAVQIDSSLGTGGGTYDLSYTNWTDVPAGTHVRLGPNLTNDNNTNDGILSYNGQGSGINQPTFISTGGNQVIAYTGSSSAPTYIAGLHWGTAGGWPDPSYAPGTSSDLSLGTYNNYYFNGLLTGTLYTDRNNLINSGNWMGSSIWIDYQSQPLPVELSLFSGVIIDYKVYLKWRTETEVNDYGFEIQRSTDKVSWNKIGFVLGNGNSNSPKNYSFTDNSTLNGIIFYRLKQIDVDGKFEYSKIIEINYTVSPNASLSQNYPNPFNPVSTIEYSVPAYGFVSLKVYDVLGRLVTTLVNEKQDVGQYSVKFNGTGLASGIYFYVLKTNKFVLSKKMILLK